MPPPSGDITVGSVSEIDKVEIDTGIAVGTVSINGARADSCIAGSDAGEGVKAKSIRVVAGKGKKFGNIAAVKVFGLRSVDKVSVEAAAGNSISDVTVVGNHAGLTIEEVAVSAGSGSRLDNVVLERVISVTKSVVVEVHANVHTYNGLVIGEKRLLDKDLVLAVYKDCSDHNNDDCLSSEAADGGDCDGGLIRASDKSCFAQGGGDACTMEVPATTTVAATTTTVAATTTTKVPTTVAAEVGAATTTAAAAAPADTTTIAPADSTTTVAAAAPADTTTVAPADPTTTVAAAAPAGTTTVADAAETTTLAGVAEPPVGDSAEPVVHDAGGDGDAGTPEEGKFVVGEAASPTASPAVEGKTGDAPEEEPSGATESTGAAEPSDTGADDGATPTGPEEDEAGAAGADEVAAGANDVATSAADCNAGLLETTGSLCMNGGVCEFKRANCNNADLPFDTPVCACPSVAFGTCFYGEHCQMQTSDCSADTLSCNIVKSLRSTVDPATAVCSTDEWPARLCTAAQPPALAGASSATLLEEDGIAPAKKSGAGGAVAAVLLIIFAAVLLGMYHHKRQQAVAGDGDGGSTNPMYLEPFGTKILSSVENPMYLEPVPLASPDYIAPAPVGGAEPMYEIGNVGDEPVYELGNGEGDEPLYDLGNGDGDGDGYLAVGDGVDADAMYDLAGNATESVDAEAMYDLAGNTQVLLNKANGSAVKETEAQRLRRLGMENGLERDAKMHTFTLEKPLRAVDDTSFDVAAAEKKRKASMKKSKKAKTPTTKKKSTTTSKKAKKSKKKKTEKDEAVLNNDFV